MIYGANGYTGRLVAEEAVRTGHRPVLAGRRREAVKTLAGQLGLDYRVFDLTDRQAIMTALKGIDLVYHAAGPYTITAGPMRRACLDSGVHYVDITGEIAVLEATLALDGEARRRGVALVSGAGFDVIPTDCMAAYAARRSRGAHALEVGVAAPSRASRGTARSFMEIAALGGLVRRNGELIAEPIGAHRVTIRFPHGEREAISIPWGDLSTAYRTTGLSNITTYYALPPRLIRLIRRTSGLGETLLGWKPLRRLAQLAAGAFARGPGEDLRQRGRSYVWVRVSGPDGQPVEAWLETVEAYRFTAEAGVLAVERLLAERPIGALTPSQALGIDFVLQIAGTRRYDALPDQPEAAAL
jgi:short subunit dehydrogenase-like uncharacterized protein